MKYSIIDRNRGLTGKLEVNAAVVLIKFSAENSDTIQLFSEDLTEFFRQNDFAVTDLTNNCNFGMSSRTPKSSAWREEHKRKSFLEYREERRNKINENTKKVLDFLKEKKESYPSEINRQLGFPLGTANHIIYRLLFMEKIIITRRIGTITFYGLKEEQKIEAISQ